MCCSFGRNRPRICAATPVGDLDAAREPRAGHDGPADPHRRATADRGADVTASGRVSAAAHACGRAPAYLKEPLRQTTSELVIQADGPDGLVV